MTGQRNVKAKPEQEKKSSEVAPIHWAALREAGTFRGMLVLLWIHKIFGRGIFNLALYPVMLYFVFFRKVSTAASLDFLRTHYRMRPDFWSRAPGRKDVFRHYMAFGHSVLDKLLAWSVNISEDEFEIGNESLLHDFLNETTGQLIIGSHLGNLEYCRGFVHRYKNKTINILVYDQHAANFVEMMQRINAESRVHVYQVNQIDIATILSLKAKIDAGEWLFIAGDRAPLSGDEHTVAVNFMARTANFAIGPYMLAKTLQCPVKLMFSYRKGRKVYFEMVPFAEKVQIPRKQRNEALQQLAQKFASELERQSLQAPLQWFNFYPFWSSATDTGVDVNNSGLDKESQTAKNSVEP